jgi:hypothetical protein
MARKGDTGIHAVATAPIQIDMTRCSSGFWRSDNVVGERRTQAASE